MAATAADDVSVALVNDRLEFGIEVTTKKSQLPCCYTWQNFQSGNYVFGIEPSTHHILGNNAARQRGEMIWLGAQEERRYKARFKILESAEMISETENRIANIAKQPAERYPEPSGQFRQLEGHGNASMAETN